MKNKFFTDKLEEKIYYSNSTDSIEEIQKVLNSFINEVIKRRRNDEAEEGLQAVLIIGKEEFGAKITENNGSGSHQNSSINIIKYFNYDNNYISLEGTKYNNLYTEEYNELCFKTIQITIQSSEKKLKFIINSIFNKYIELSEFQDIMIKIFSNVIEELKQNNIYQTIEVVGKFPSSKDYYETNSTNKK